MEIDAVAIAVTQETESREAPAENLGGDDQRGSKFSGGGVGKKEIN